MAQALKLPHGCPHIRVPTAVLEGVLAIPLPLQLPVNASLEEADGDSSI